MGAYFPSEFEMDFNSHEDFTTFLENEPWFLSATSIDAWVVDVLANGIQEPITQTVYDSSDITNDTTNYREGIVAGGLNSRQRAMLRAMKTLNPATGGLENCDIYGLEQVTAFAARIKRICPAFVGSEYIPSEAARMASPHIHHEDLLSLSFEDDSFDMVFSNDVLEHVPDVDQALREVYRVLRPNGVFVSTFPFRYGRYESEIKASMNGEEIIYHCEPEYHGNPVDPNGSLVFEVPGWDILDRARNLGFSRSYVRATASKRYGYIGAEMPAILINVFEK